MSYSDIQLIWRTNSTGVVMLTAAVLFSWWGSLCDYPDSVTRHVLTKSRVFWESLWRVIWEDVFQCNDFLIHTLGTTLLVFFLFLVFNSVFFMADVTGYPTWLAKYKVQEYKKLTNIKLASCLKVCTEHLLITNLLFNIISYPLTHYLGAMHTGTLPSFIRFVGEFFVFKLLEEFGNYYSHRLLHMPGWYKHHKKHHEWTTPISITSMYCSRTEHLFANILPVATGPFLLRSHLLVTWIMLTHVMYNTTLEHCGYHIPFLYSPQPHDYHHKTYGSWYGTLAFLDILHGTDKPFSDTINKERHYVSCSLIPVSQLVSDR